MTILKNTSRFIILSSLSLFALGVLYIFVTSLGLMSLNQPTDPIGNPYLSIMEIIIITMTPFMVMLTVSIYVYNGDNNRVTNLLSVVFMVMASTLTSGVHMVVLSINNQAGSSQLPWYNQFFGWVWPSVVYALDILAWDFFFALAILLLIPNFIRKSRLIVVLLMISGILSLVGLVSIMTGDMQFRLMTGVVGYALVFPFASLMIGLKYFRMKI